MRNKQKMRRITRLLFDLTLEIAGLVLLAVILYAAQTQYSVYRQQENSSIKLDIAEERINLYQQQSEDDKSRYDDFDQAKADALTYFYERNPEKSLYGMPEKWGIQEIYLLDTQRRVVSSNRAECPDFAEAEQFAALWEKQEPVTVGDMRYYMSLRKNGGYLIAGRYSEKEIALETEKLTPEYSLHNIKVGSNGYIMALDMDGTILYHPESADMGKKAADLGIHKEVLHDGYDGWTSYGGEEYYAQVRSINDRYLFIAVVPKAEINTYNVHKVGMILGVFIVILTLIVIYVHFLHQEQIIKTRREGRGNYISIGKHLEFDGNIAVQCKNILLIGVLIIFFMSYYIQNLLALSAQTVRSENKLDAIETIFQDNDVKYQELKDEYTREYVGRAKNIASMLAEDPSLVENEALKELAERAQIRNIYVFDDQGKVVATNSSITDFQLSSNESHHSYEFWDIVRGHTEVIAQDAVEDPNSDTGFTQYIGVRRRDADGMVQLGISPKRLENRLKAVQMNTVMGTIAVENNGFLMAVDGEEKTISYDANHKLIGVQASELGFSDTAFQDGYVGYQTINHQKCFASCMEYNGKLIYVLVPTANIGNGILQLSVITTVLSFLILLMIIIPLLITRTGNDKADEEIAETEGFKAEPRGMIDITDNTGTRRRVQSVLGRWDGSSAIAWNDKTAGQKLQMVMNVIFGVLAVVLVGYFYEQQSIYDSTSILSYIVHQRWEKAPNIFSFTYIALISVEVLVFSWLIRKVMKVTLSGFGARTETIERLCRSFIKYIAVIGLVFYSLSVIGIDSKSMLASAGIFTLVVGLGAQSLISDIIAGIFIVFEGEFRVGDIITIGDWRGTVQEIGIRSTKVEDASQNIKIINNSAISNVVNMTKKYSYASCDVGIEYHESLEHVESILQKELPKMKEKLPAIEAGPYYKGVVELADSSVNIRILAQCQEKDRIQLCRDMNRQIKLIFDKHGISIPFAQVVVNKPTEFKDATVREKRSAAKFVEEQKKESKDILIDDK